MVVKRRKTTWNAREPCTSAWNPLTHQHKKKHKLLKLKILKMLVLEHQATFLSKTGSKMKLRAWSFVFLLRYTILQFLNTTFLQETFIMLPKNWSQCWDQFFGTILWTSDRYMHRPDHQMVDLASIHLGLASLQFSAHLEVGSRARLGYRVRARLLMSLVVLKLVQVNTLWSVV